MMMRRFFLAILCLGAAIGGECLAMDVAAKHLEDYRPQCRACGDEDALQELRLQCRYQISQDAAQADLLDSATWGRNMPTILALHEKAYRLAEARYRNGLGSLWDMYETGMELYCYTESYASICSYHSRPVPEALVSLAQLEELRQKLCKAAVAPENRERWLRAEALWFTGIVPERSKVRAYRAELAELQQKRYRQGMATQWELALTELDLQESGLFLPPAEEVLPRWEEYSKAITRLYEQMKEVAAAHPSYHFSQMLCELRLRQISTERTLSVLKAVPSVIEQEVAETEGLFLPAPPVPENVSRDAVRVIYGIRRFPISVCGTVKMR